MQAFDKEVVKIARITKAPEERRQEIIDTAVRVFAEKGYEKTSIGDIAKAMHVAQGLCYRYFKSKEELFDIALDQYAERQVQILCSKIDRRQSLTEMVTTMPTFLDAEKEESDVEKLCHSPGNEKFHQSLSLKICEKLMPVVEELLNCAEARGEIRLADSHTAASFCIYGQLGVLMDISIPAEERVERICQFLLKFIKAFV